MQRSGRTISLRKRKDAERKSRTGKPRAKSGRRRPSACDGMQGLGKGELKKTEESQR
ncbi:Hypothetical predicted protein, partial [Paramuricea clavata]